ncbi:MAG: thioredoxin [Pseudomonadota bacterium]
MSTPGEHATTDLFDVTVSEFDARVAQADVPVLVDFWAPWCGPCQHIAPILESLVARYAGQLRVAKVNVDEESQLAAAFNVRSIPMLVLFHQGKVVEQIIGLQPEQELVSLIDKYVTPDGGSPDTGAQVAAAHDDPRAALSQLREALAGDPDNPSILADIARTEFSLGELDATTTTLAQLPADAIAEQGLEPLQLQLAMAQLASDFDTSDALQSAVDSNPADATSRYQLAIRRAVEQDHDAAIEHLFGVLQSDMNFADGQARQSLLGVFDILGGADQRVQQARRRLSSMLH